MNGAPARRVVDCLHTVGPAEIYACGAEPLPKAPTNVSDGHGRVPLSGCRVRPRNPLPSGMGSGQTMHTFMAMAVAT